MAFSLSRLKILFTAEPFSAKILTDSGIQMGRFKGKRGVFLAFSHHPLFITEFMRLKSKDRMYLDT